VSESTDTGPVQQVLHRMAYDAGGTTAAAAEDLVSALADAGCGQRQQDADKGALVLGNRPFHRLATFSAARYGAGEHSVAMSVSAARTRSRRARPAQPVSGDANEGNQP
jgi:hypothetical protein